MGLITPELLGRQIWTHGGEQHLSLSSQDAGAPDGQGVLAQGSGLAQPATISTAALYGSLPCPRLHLFLVTPLSIQYKVM